MPESETTSEFVRADLTGARFERVRLNEANFRMVDFSGAFMRDVSLVDVVIDGEIDGLIINDVDVAPLVEAELARRDPARALRRADNPSDLRAGWSAIEQSWAASYDRVAAMPAGTVDISVAEEWTFTETLRHLIFATDAWLGAILNDEKPFHRWGMPFTDMEVFIKRPAAELGVDVAATPSYAEVLELRADRVAKVRAFLAEVSAERLAEEVEGPLWEDGRRLSVLRCLWVILNEECEHRRFAERDLDLIEAGSPLVGSRAR